MCVEADGAADVMVVGVVVGGVSITEVEVSCGGKLKETPA